MNAAQRHLGAALAAEGRAHRALLAGAPAGAHLAAARDAYLASYGEAKRGSWGRLLGATKAAVLAGAGAGEAAATARREAAEPATAPAAYVRALADVVLGDPPHPAALALMEAAGGSFRTTARALGAIGAGDAAAYAAASAELLADFEARDAFLTGVPFADTVAVLDRLAAGRGIAASRSSALLPP